MLAERLRFSWWYALTLAPLVAGVIVAAPTPSSARRMMRPLRVCHEAMPGRIGQHPQPPAVVDDALLYRRGDFSAAANAARPRDRNLAELYDQLAVQWTIAFSVHSTATEAVPALREAGKLDVVLGGAFTAAIHDRMGQVLPLAAADYYALGDYAAARRTVELADMLGIRTATVNLIERRLHDVR